MAPKPQKVEYRINEELSSIEPLVEKAKSRSFVEADPSTLVKGINAIEATKRFLQAAIVRAIGNSASAIAMAIKNNLRSAAPLRQS